MTHLLQLNPPIPLRHVDGRKFLALVLIDYGPDWDLLYVGGFEDSRELWTLPNKLLRLDDNISLGRPPIR